MKKLSNITESVWADIHKRSNGETVRQEDGVKVHTCLGVDMVIKSKKCDYDKCIQDIMNHGNLMVSQMDSIGNLTVDEREEIRNWENPYFYLISGYDSYELVATFIKYNDLIDTELISPDDLYEEDYIEICRCISTKVREITNYLEFIPLYNNAKMHSHYCCSYHPFLVKVSKKLDKDELTHFTEELEKQFPELDGVDLIYWYKYDETYLALPISFVTVMNLKDYIKFTKEWFGLNESVWADIHKRSNGTQIRKEDDVNLLDAQGFVEYLKDIYKNVNTDFYIFKDLNDVITVPVFETELGTKSTWFILYDCPHNSVLIWDHFLNEDYTLFDKLKKKYNVKDYHINRNFADNFSIAPKTGKPSNKFFIEIIDFLLENTNIFFHRILVKEDNMNESVWADIHKRSSGKQERKEDIIKTNVAELKPVDIGVSVLWSDKDLEIDGEIFWGINVIKGFQKDGWRLPVQKEADELMTDAIWSSTRDPHTIKRYYEIGITHISDAITKKDASEENTIYFTCEIGKAVEYWLDDRAPHTPAEYWSTFSFRHDGSFFPHSAYSITKIDGGRKCRVRLVKDK